MTLKCAHKTIIPTQEGNGDTLEVPCVYCGEKRKSVTRRGYLIVKEKHDKIQCIHGKLTSS